MKFSPLVAAFALVAGCATPHPAVNRDGPRLVVAYGGDGRGAVEPCG